MNPQALTLEQIREQGLAALRQPLGIVGLVRFLQPSDMGWGNYTEERDQYSTRASRFQTRPSARLHPWHRCRCAERLGLTSQTKEGPERERTPEELRGEFRQSLPVFLVISSAY
jgi:hypothetical protein